MYLLLFFGWTFLQVLQVCVLFLCHTSTPHLLHWLGTLLPDILTSTGWPSVTSHTAGCTAWAQTLRSTQRAACGTAAPTTPPWNESGTCKVGQQPLLPYTQVILLNGRFSKVMTHFNFLSIVLKLKNINQNFLTDALYWKPRHVKWQWIIFKVQV